MRIIKVSGHSMRPVYADGDFLLVGGRRHKRPAIGDDIVVEHQDYGPVLKRVTDVELDRLRLRGLNLLSAESAALTIPLNATYKGHRRVLWHVPRRNG